MRILVDTNFLIYMIDRREGGSLVDQDRHAKLHDLVEQVEAARGAILLPTPVLGEYLLNARNAGSEILAGLQRHRRIRITGFDEVAAHEAALLHRAAWDEGGHKRAPMPEDDDYQRIKVDWQVVAIAKVHQARVVTNDRRLAALARTASLRVDVIDEMPLPASAQQLQLAAVEPAPRLWLRKLPKSVPRATPGDEVSGQGRTDTPA